MARWTTRAGKGAGGGDTVACCPWTRGGQATNGPACPQLSWKSIGAGSAAAEPESAYRGDQARDQHTGGDREWVDDRAERSRPTGSNGRPPPGEWYPT